MVDPFKIGSGWFSADPTQEYQNWYCYHNIQYFVDTNQAGFGPEDVVNYGQWRIWSVGPTQLYQPWRVYDPTNGTVSNGNIVRTHRSPEGKRFETTFIPD